MVNPWKNVLDEIRDSKHEAEEALGYPHVEVRFEEPPEKFGDVGFDTFRYSKALKRSPESIAEELSKAMKPGQLVSSHNCAGPYVNSKINMVAYSKLTVDTILRLGEKYGCVPIRNVKVVLEHTSVNPTGPIHVGRARNPILGDTLARVMKKAGYDVSSEFYVNDVGKQVVMLAWGVLNLPEYKALDEHKGKMDHVLVRAYQRVYELSDKDESVKDDINRMLRSFEAGDEDLTAEIKAIVKRMLDGMLSSLDKIDVKIDNFVWESEFVRTRKVYEVVEKLRMDDLCKEDDGALYLDIKSFVPGQERYYITRSDGTTLYTTRDLAYHMDKLERCDLAINVLGEDQKLGMKALKVGLKMLGADRAPENVFYAFVSLPEGRMSTRKGVVVYLDDLVDEAVERAYIEVKKRRGDLSEDERRNIARVVGTGAIRYNLIRVQAEKPIVFRWSEALNFEGNSAPFNQYAHARCHGILSKADRRVSKEECDTSLLAHPNELELVKVLSRFPVTIEGCAQARMVHPLASYTYQLASTFNLFYRDCPVLTAEGGLRDARLALVESTKVVLRNALNCMGIHAPDSM